MAGAELRLQRSIANWSDKGQAAVCLTICGKLLPAVLPCHALLQAPAPQAELSSAAVDPLQHKAIKDVAVVQPAVSLSILVAVLRGRRTETGLAAVVGVCSRDTRRCCVLPIRHQLNTVANTGQAVARHASYKATGTEYCVLCLTTKFCSLPTASTSRMAASVGAGGGYLPSTLRRCLMMPCRGGGSVWQQEPGRSAGT
jgi:hypothetical protein